MKTIKTDDSPELWQTIGGRLKKLRKAREWTLMDVTVRTRIPPDQLTRLENGFNGCSLTRLIRLAMVYEVSLDELLKELPVEPVLKNPGSTLNALPRDVAIALRGQSLTEAEMVELATYAAKLVEERRQAVGREHRASRDRIRADKAKKQQDG